MIVSITDFELTMKAARQLRDSGDCTDFEKKMLSIISSECSRARNIMLAMQNDIEPIKREINRHCGELAPETVVALLKEVSKRKAERNEA
jgi:hypothetical protein